jgi:hypothetical protein
MYKDRCVLHNCLRNLWKRKGVEAGGIATSEPCTDDILANQFGPAILRHAFPKAPSAAAKQTAAKIHELIKQATKPSANRNALIQEINHLAASTSTKQKGLRVEVPVKFKRLKDVWIDQVCTHAINSSKLLQTAKFVVNVNTAERNAGAVDLDQYHAFPRPFPECSRLSLDEAAHIPATRRHRRGTACKQRPGPHAQLLPMRPLA